MTTAPKIVSEIQLWTVDRLKPYERNARTHSERQIEQIAASILEFGFTNPILVDTQDGIIAGHGRLLAAKRLNLTEVPVIILDHLSDVQKRAYILADNKLALNAGWDDELLKAELSALDNDDFDLTLAGFSDDELAAMLPDLTDEPTEQARENVTQTDEEDDEDTQQRAEETDNEDEPEDEEERAAPVPLSAPKRVSSGQVWKLGRHLLICGDSTDKETVHKWIPENVGHAIVTDPPYGLGEIKDLSAFLSAWMRGTHDENAVGRGGFMGKAWDATVPPPGVWKVWASRARPGSHALVFSGTRTQDLMGLSLRLAGLEIRDQAAWIYSQGFPKSLDISKALDREAGAEREVVGVKPKTRADNPSSGSPKGGRSSGELFDDPRDAMLVTAPATDAARTWNGFGTALKPAQECISIARVPLSEDTVAKNVLRWGTSGLNIDGTRIGTDIVGWGGGGGGVNSWKEGGNLGKSGEPRPVEGRFPANIFFDEEAAAALDEQSGIAKPKPPSVRTRTENNVLGKASGVGKECILRADEGGGASRFFYIAKSSKSDRGEGNTHATVKPLRLMEYLCRLVTPPGGVVLEPFCGSGTTLLACEREGFTCYAFEQDPLHCDIILSRFETLTGLSPECVEG